MITIRGAIVCCCFVLALRSPDAAAQAIVDEPGSLTGSLAHSYGFADRIVETDGATFPNNFIDTQTTTLELEYVPVAKLAIGVALPLVGTKYDKAESGNDYDPHGPYDDGNYHFTLQDLRADARYQVLAEPLALAFHAGVTLPVTDYPVRGTAAPGRNLKQGRLGVAITVAPEALPHTFLSASYELVLSEKFDMSPDTEKFGQSRSVAGAQIGYLPTDNLGIYTLAAYRRQHDGIDFVDFDMLTPMQEEYHDVLLRESALLVGLGAMYRLTDKLDLSAYYAHFIAGENTLNMSVLTLALGWNIL